MLVNAVDDTVLATWLNGSYRLPLMGGQQLHIASVCKIGCDKSNTLITIHICDRRQFYLRPETRVSFYNCRKS